MPHPEFPSLLPPFTHPFYAPALRIAQHLRAADNIAITAHANPDGDALGAMLALGHGLRLLGKRAALCNASPLPEQYAWLGLPGPVYSRLKDVPFKPAISLVLDCGDAARMGYELAGAMTTLPCINIDHHLGNPNFGNLDNWVEPRMTATGQMAAAVLAALDVPLRGDVAEAVYVAMSSDSGGFTFDNVTAEVFELTAYLVREGLDVAALRRRMDNQWSLPRMRLWGRLLSQFTQECEGRVALIAVEQADLAAVGAGKEDLEGFTEHMRRLKGVQIAALVREDAAGRCKISLRSSGPCDVRRMVEQFGGGGHRNAAGATLNMPLDKAVRAVRQVIGQGLAEGTAPETQAH